MFTSTSTFSVLLFLYKANDTVWKTQTVLSCLCHCKTAKDFQLIMKFNCNEECHY